MIPARILGTGSALAGRSHSTEELVEAALPGRDSAEVEGKTGVRARRWVPAGTTAAALGAEALRAALAAAGLAAGDLQRIVFVSSTGGDGLIPATANGVAEALGVDDTCDAFDLNNACTGFLSALDVAARSAATGVAPVAVVAAELFSRYLPPDEPRPYLVLGDAAAAVIVGPGRPGEGVLATWLRNSAALRGRVRMDLPGAWGGARAPSPGAPPALIAMTGAPPRLKFHASYDELTRSALDAMRSSSEAVTARAGITPRDVEWFVPHQANGRMLALVADAMRIDPSRILDVTSELGSLGAASIPLCLDRLMRERPVRPGDRILMTSVGAGTAYGATLYRVAP